MEKRREVKREGRGASGVIGGPAVSPGTPHLGRCGWLPNYTLGGPPNRMGISWGLKVVFRGGGGGSKGQVAGRAGHPHAALQGSTGLLLGLFKA